MRIIFSPELLSLSRKIEEAQAEEYTLSRAELTLVRETSLCLDGLWKTSYRPFRVSSQRSVALPQTESADELASATIGPADGFVSRFCSIVTEPPCQTVDNSINMFGLWLPCTQPTVYSDDGIFEARNIFMKIDSGLTIEVFPKHLPYPSSQSCF